MARRGGVANSERATFLPLACAAFPIQHHQTGRRSVLDLGKEPSLATDDRITASPVAAPTPTPIAEWHVIHAGQEVGPLSLAALVEKAVVGDVEADDLVKQTGGLWTKASDFRFLRDARTDGDRQRRQPFPVKDYT